MRTLIRDIEEEMTLELDRAVLEFFLPNLTRLTDRDVSWVMRMIGQVKSGRGISQENFARLVVPFSRLPGGQHYMIGYEPRRGTWVYSRWVWASNFGSLRFRKYRYRSLEDGITIKTPFDRGPDVPEQTLYLHVPKPSKKEAA